MELSALRNFKMALSATATGDASARTHARRRHSSSSNSSSASSKSVSSASSIAGSPIGRFRDHEDDDELRSERSNASSRSSSGVAATAARVAAVRDAHVNLPLDKEFVPLAHHDDDDLNDAEREAMAARDDVRDDVIRMIFDLPDTTKFYQGTSALARTC